MTSSVRVARPPETVFGYAANYENDPLWRSEVVSIRKVSDGPFREGTRFLETTRIFGVTFDVPLEVTTYAPPSRVVVESTGGPVSVVSTRRFTPVPSGTRVEGVLELDAGDGFLRSAVNWVLGHYFQYRYDRYLARLKRLLESDGSSE